MPRFYRHASRGSTESRPRPDGGASGGRSPIVVGSAIQGNEVARGMDVCDRTALLARRRDDDPVGGLGDRIDRGARKIPGGDEIVPVLGASLVAAGLSANCGFREAVDFPPSAALCPSSGEPAVLFGWNHPLDGGLSASEKEATREKDGLPPVHSGRKPDGENASMAPWWWPTRPESILANH